MKDSYRVDGDEFMYYRHNDPQPGRPTLLFVHGLGDSGLSFEDVFTDERFSNFNLVVPDLVGYGRSSDAASPERYGYEYHLNRLRSLIAALKLDRIVLVGHSMGGDLTTLLCDADSDGLFRKYVNIEGDVTQYDLTISRMTVEAHRRGEFNAWFTAEFRDRLVYKGLGRARSGKIYFASLMYCRPEALMANAVELVERNSSLSGKYKSDTGKKYCALTLPRVFCYGVKSLAAESLAFLKENGMTVRAFEGVGHCPMTDASEEFYDFLVDFVSDV